MAESPPYPPCQRGGCNALGVVPIYAPLTGKRAHSCAEHLSWLLGMHELGWEVADRQTDDPAPEVTDV